MIRPKLFFEQKEGRSPLLNYVERINNAVGFSDYSQINKKKRLMYLVLRTPELTGMLWDITEDTVGRIDFVPVGRKNSGRNRVNKVKQWARKVKLRDMMMAMVFDSLATGEGYIYLGAKATEIMEQINRVINEDLKQKMYDEVIYDPLFKPVASTTMTNNHNTFRLVGYTQSISGHEEKYSPREMIHLYFKRFAGKVDGFTVVSTIPIQLELLWLLWTNQYDLQAKGNMPDLIVTAEDIRSNTPALKDVEQKLKKYNMPGNSKHGTTVLYGSKFNFEQLEKDTTLQFKDVGMAITSVMASLFRYPKHRLGIKTKESASDKDPQGNSDRDYWLLINKYQDKVSEILNTQLFEPFFGVHMVFDQSYKHDSVVENTAMRSRIDNINLVNNMLHQYGKQIPEDDIIRFISGKSIEYNTEEYEVPDFQEDMPMMGTPPRMKDEQLSAEKKKSEMETQKNTGGVRKQ